MICYICHESINDYIEDYVFCNNCGNLFHEDCVNTNKPCPVCDEIESLETINEKL